MSDYRLPPYRDRTRKDWLIWAFTWRGRTWKDRLLFTGWLGTFIFAGLYISLGVICS